MNWAAANGCSLFVRVLMARLAGCTPRFVPKHRLGCHVEHGLRPMHVKACGTWRTSHASCERMWDVVCVLCR
ncbi:MAG TPA: hypothetical protein DDX19_25620 [Rhodopirellula baltica]|nr:hypothetical protein [Rhodopirellula baltica]